MFFPFICPLLIDFLTGGYVSAQCEELGTYLTRFEPVDADSYPDDYSFLEAVTTLRADHTRRGPLLSSIIACQDDLRRFGAPKVVSAGHLSLRV